MASIKWLQAFAWTYWALRNLLSFAESFNFYIDIKLFFIVYYERKNVTYGLVFMFFAYKKGRDYSPGYHDIKISNWCI